MKCVMIFLVLTLVVLMAEPGEGFLGGIKAIIKGAKKAYKDYKYQRDMNKFAKRYGVKWEKPQPQPQAEPDEGASAQPEGDGPNFLVFDR